MALKLHVLLFTLVVALGGQVSFAADKQTLSLRGLFDFQYHHTDSGKSYLERGPGVFRYDGKANQKLNFNFAGLELSWRPSLTQKFKISAQYSPEQDDAFGEQRLQITEAYWQYRPSQNSKWRNQYRIGAFYPSMSMENRGLMWTSTNTTKFSGINSWIADELRTIGAEGSWKIKSGPSAFVKELGFVAAVHWFNDPSGAMISWRGFNLHDRQTGLGGTTPLWRTPGIRNTRNPQASVYEPFLELDHKPGFYFGINSKLAPRQATGEIKLSAYYYDNAADETEFSQGQYGWRTKFFHLGVDWQLQPGLSLLAQYLDGNTKMDTDFVDNDFTAFYVMLVKGIRHHRFAIRAEKFKVVDLDDMPLDDNDDDSHAFTASYNYSFLKQWKLGIESSFYDSKRGRRIHFGQKAHRQERQHSISLRYYFAVAN